MKLKAGFMGSPEFAVPSLLTVARVCDLRVVVCQPDRPAGRGQKLTPPAVKVAAMPLGVPIEQPVKMKDGSLAAALAQHDLDVLVVVAFGRILPTTILDLPRYGCINVHGSILPRWRGAAPIQRAVLAGDAETGVSIMKMDAGLDTGPVFDIVRTAIAPEETSGGLFERLSKLGSEALGPFLERFPDVEAPIPQDEGLATHAAMLSKDEGVTDWSRSVRAVIDHVRGMEPWPVATALRGDDRLKLYAAKPSARVAEEEPSGTIVAVDAEGMHVRVGDGVICVGEVQPPGRRRMPASAYFAGKPLRRDERLTASSS